MGKNPVDKLRMNKWQRGCDREVAQCFSTLGPMPSKPNALEISSCVAKCLENISFGDGKWTYWVGELWFIIVLQSGIGWGSLLCKTKLVPSTVYLETSAATFGKSKAKLLSHYFLSVLI